jgi:hypothetical protein
MIHFSAMSTLCNVGTLRSLEAKRLPQISRIYSCRNRYPSPTSVTRYCGRWGAGSSFKRKFRIPRRYGLGIWEEAGTKPYHWPGAPPT